MGRKRKPSIYTRPGFGQPRRGPFRVPDREADAPLPDACEIDARREQRLAHVRRRLGLDDAGN